MLAIVTPSSCDLKLVSRSAAANKRFYAGSPLEQSSRDASAETTGSSRHDDCRVIHDSDIRERTPWMQSGRRSEPPENM